MRRSNTRWIAALGLIAGLATPVTASAQLIVYTAHLSGDIEVPPVATPGSGFAMLTYNQLSRQLRVQANFSDLTGLTMASHIHCCTVDPFPAAIDQAAGVATQTPSFAGFPLGVQNGTYDMTFDLSLASSWNPTFIIANGGTTLSAEAALFAGLNSHRAYFNIHTDFRPGGEIRGFFAVVPEPSTYALMALGLSALALVAHRRRV